MLERVATTASPLRALVALLAASIAWFALAPSGRPPAPEPVRGGAPTCAMVRPAPGPVHE
jgi:hypothetical protein